MDAKVLLGRLYEKTSSKGNRYFTGRLGAARVVMLLDAHAEGTDPTWQLFVQDGDDKGKGKQPLADHPPEARQRPQEARHGSGQGNGRQRRQGRQAAPPADWQAPVGNDAPFNDEIGF